MRKRRPDVLFLAEVPYQYEAEHPHAKNYRITYGANPESCDYADIVLFRCTGPLMLPRPSRSSDTGGGPGSGLCSPTERIPTGTLPPGTDVFQQSSELYGARPRHLAMVLGSIVSTRWSTPT